MSLEFWAIAAVGVLMFAAVLIPIALHKHVSFGWAITIAAGCLAAALAIGIGMSARQSTRFHDDCIDMGGKYHRIGDEAICVFTDGRILGD